MRFERKITSRSFKILIATELVVLCLYSIWTSLMSNKVSSNTAKILIHGVCIITLIALSIIQMYMTYACDFAYTINVEGDKVVITDDYGETKWFYRDFVIVGRSEVEYKILIRDGIRPDLFIPYNSKVLKYLKEINPNCMGKRLKKVIIVP